MRQFLARTLLALAIAGCGKSATESSPSNAKKPAVVDQAVKETRDESGTAAASGSSQGSASTGVGGAIAAAPMTVPAGGNTEQYKDYGQNGWTDAKKDNLSTFAADVDTASYTIARRKLGEGALPPASAVRVEEFVNYFKYAYPEPGGDAPFSVHVDAAPSPFDGSKKIVRVGVSTRAKSLAERKNANLVFLVDTSGSMQSPDKLELAKRSLRILVDNLKDGDQVALVTYAGNTSLVLPATGLDHKQQILEAIEDLSAAGSTAMASGIDLAYEQAMKMRRPGTETRVIVCTDGDANVGSTSHDEILAQIAGAVKEGVTLSTIGFGMGNYKDELMEQLADKGNGNNFYVDGISAAKRIFQEQLGSTLEVVAQDVKLQVEFDPKVVAQYRLIGYENRNIADDDFRKDEVDAGEIGAGHQVTAMYEIEPVTGATFDHIGTVHVRAKAPKGTTATESTFAEADISAKLDAAPADLRFAFAVAAFADVLRGGEDASHWSLETIRAIAAGAAGDDADRKELVGLIDQAIALSKSPDRHPGVTG